MNWPIPRDIPLPLPADPVLLQALLVMLFLLHILFVNLMIGGTVLTVVFEILGRRRPEFDRLAREIGRTITVNKSVAVVLGVGPLLALNVLYTVYWYSANALTGAAWLSLIPVITLAFLITYVHKYTWDRLADLKGLHIAIGCAGAALFLFIPLIFLANVNLMNFPARWADVHGFLSALVLPNVLPRYLHFVTASLAVTGLFLLVYFLRDGFDVEGRLAPLDRRRLRRMFYGLALGATALQALFGPLLLLTLPSEGMSWTLVLIVSVGVSLAIAAVVVMWREITAPAARAWPRGLAVLVLITLTAFAMGYGRQFYRESAVQEHRLLMEAHTRDFGWAAAAAQHRAATGQVRTATPLGQRIYESTCAACHARDRVLVGPPLTEIADIYGGDLGGLVAWARDPGKKRAGFPQMPAFRLGDEKLQAVAEYMVKAGRGESAS